MNQLRIRPLIKRSGRGYTCFSNNIHASGITAEEAYDNWRALLVLCTPPPRVNTTARFLQDQLQKSLQGRLQSTTLYPLMNNGRPLM